MRPKLRLIKQKAVGRSKIASRLMHVAVAVRVVGKKKKKVVGCVVVVKCFLKIYMYIIIYIFL